MSRSELYHVGIVVPDLESARERFSALLGLGWGPVVEGLVEVRDAGGNDLVVPNRICYSTEPPYLELIEETPGTIWVCNEYSNLHHIGFFSDSLVADSVDLASVRCPLELQGRDGTHAPVNWTYHRDPLGVRIEQVDVAIRPMMEQYLFRAPE
jgi:catechol 2,3-dioxygenase-like lactoylglutathione lyase family enzyme